MHVPADVNGDGTLLNRRSKVAVALTDAGWQSEVAAPKWRPMSEQHIDCSGRRRPVRGLGAARHVERPVPEGRLPWRPVDGVALDLSEFVLQVRAAGKQPASLSTVVRLPLVEAVGARCIVVVFVGGDVMVASDNDLVCAWVACHPAAKALNLLVTTRRREVTGME
eukprot:CAMPEP_0119089428 /NCGR_PEP_ID=MMETSP1178-20130426/149010_1 /TAXON_ID=33656 /ORGANISM="unid sp, Strain CCMP2000" /LENGTH=165 /DNA_ID=CAMNT_0007072783 /DNA_START=251 /DNA_END=748 /DNA_ORIENTATION=+